jgi:predicted Zn-dependent peptidase
MNSVPLFLSLPGPRGYQAATVFLNTGEMLEAVKRNTVKDALEAALKILRGWKFEPAVITNSGNDVSAPV